MLVAVLNLAIAGWNSDHGTATGRISIILPVNFRPAAVARRDGRQPRAHDSDTAKRLQAVPNGMSPQTRRHVIDILIDTVRRSAE